MLGVLLLCAFLAAPGQLRAESRYYDLAGNLTLIEGGGISRIALPSAFTTHLSQTNANLFLSVAVSGDVPYTVQWFKGNTAIANATNVTLTRTGITAGDAGDYRVVVTAASTTLVSTITRVDLDSDRDGLGDAWELTNFGNLTVSDGETDRDGDGVTDRQEFEDSTNPNSAASVRPRPVLVGLGGDVEINPLKSSYNANEAVTLTATPADRFVGWFGQVTGTNNPILAGVRNGQPIYGLFGTISGTIDDAVELPRGSLRNGGNIGWFPQNTVTRDGTNALQSGPIGHSQTSTLTLTTNLAQPAFLTFWASLSANTFFGNRDVLRLTIDGQVITNLQGVVEWTQYQFPLPIGIRTIQWGYVKDAKDDDYLGVGDDAARLDLVSIALVTDPTLDTDGDGLSDLWELTYFPSLSQNANADSDNDGVNNGQEFTDGTNPASRSSFLARLSMTAVGGSLTVTPLQETYTNGQSVQLSIVPTNKNSFIGWGGALLGTNRTQTLVMNTNRRVFAVCGIPLAEAMDRQLSPVSFASTAPWFGQTNVTHDGISAAQSGPTDDGGTSRMIFSLSNSLDRVISFWWFVAPDPTDLLIFYVNGRVKGSITGSNAWQSMIAYLPAGTNQIEWQYRKRAPGTGVHAGWVDQVALTAPPPARFLPEMTISNGVFRGILQGDPRLIYGFEGTSNFVNWTSVSGLSLSNGVWQFQDSTTRPRRFYRAKLIP